MKYQCTIMLKYTAPLLSNFEVLKQEPKPHVIHVIGYDKQQYRKALCEIKLPK